MPFYKPNLFLVIVDPHRPGHELLFYPGESNLLMADVVVINKMDTAEPENIATVKANIASVNPGATIIETASPVTVEKPDVIKGKRCIVVEDGPTLTHGGMKFGAGIVAAEKFGATEVVDPRPWITGTIAETFESYPDIRKLLPAMGYGEQQIKDLEATINAADCDVVIIGTPIDLRRLLHIEKPSVRVTYNLKETGRPTVANVLEPFTK